MTPIDYQQLERFYRSALGQNVRKLFHSYVENFSEEAVTLGVGYSAPFIDDVFHMLFKDGVGEKSFQGSIEDLPLGNASINQLIAVHALEYSDKPNDAISEVWRVLKPEGSALLFLPNASGGWHDQEISPWQGKGLRYSKIENLLLANRFEIIAHDEALFMKPTESKMLLHFFGLCECLGRYMPIHPGMHVVKVRKKIYGSVLKDKGEKARAQNRGVIAAPSSRVNHFKVD